MKLQLQAVAALVLTIACSRAGLVFAQAQSTLSDAQKDAIAAIERLDGKITIKDGTVVMVDL